jgi:heterodisulfide reductase subunit A-like polyferredoxin
VKEQEQNKKPLLVVGGGISGITAAVEIAEVGMEVILIEKDAYLGGNVVKMNNYFPKLCPPACGLEINFRRIRQNQRIDVRVSTEFVDLSGEQGNYKATLKTAPQYIKDTCTACGKCIDVCPEARPDAFNYGFTGTKAVYLPHIMAFPLKYSIDEDYCKKESCNRCVKVCEYDAIDLSAREEVREVEVSLVILSTGWKNYDAGLLDNLHYKEYRNIVTNVEFERLLSPDGPGKGRLLRPSDEKEPATIVFVQCAGSRDENHLPYCSAVCCSASLKHALTIREMYPDSSIRIFYIDLRVSGRNEDFLARVEQDRNIELIKGKVAKIEELSDSGNLIVEAENTVTGQKVRAEADMVVLATGIVPNELSVDLRKNIHGFFSGEQERGLYIAGCGKKPMDVSSSVKDATAAALKAIQLKP